MRLNNVELKLHDCEYNYTNMCVCIRVNLEDFQVTVPKLEYSYVSQ